MLVKMVIQITNEDMIKQVIINDTMLKDILTEIVCIQQILKRDVNNHSKVDGNNTARKMLLTTKTIN